MECQYDRNASVGRVHRGTRLSPDAPRPPLAPAAVGAGVDAGRISIGRRLDLVWAGPDRAAVWWRGTLRRRRSERFAVFCGHLAFPQPKAHHRPKEALRARAALLGQHSAARSILVP